MNNKENIINYLKKIPYHCKGALKSIARHFAMSVSSATAVTITLVLMLIFLVLAFNISGFTKNIEQSVQILARVDKVVTEEEAIKSIGEQISKVPNVVNVTFSTKEQELDKYIETMGMDEKMFKDYKGANNPMSDAYIIDVSEGKYINEVTNNISKIEGVFDASFGGESATVMIDAFNAIRLFGGMFVIALSALAIFLISNTIKLTIYARSTEISIMRSVGATNSFIKTPFMIEGMFIGMMGAFIPILITIFGYGMIYDALGGVMFSSMFKLIAPLPYVFSISAILLLTGMVVGLVGSLLSVNKYLKFTR